MTPILTSKHIILKPLSEHDAAALYALYSNNEVQEHFDESPFLHDEGPAAFARRIIAVCNYIWTIRTIDNPDTVIGDCALHHHDKALKTTEIGGSLLPAYWGRGIMATAFNMAMQFAKKELQVTHTRTRTVPANRKALSLVRKMGFEVMFQNANEVLLGKAV